MPLSWETVALLITALVGVGKLIWDVLKRFSKKLSSRQTSRVKEKRLRSEEDRMIYKDLRERVDKQDRKIQNIRDDLHEWKDQYYNLHHTTKQVKLQNKMLSNANRKLQKAVSILRDYLDKLTKRLAEYEEIDPPPHISEEALVGGIDDDLLSSIGDMSVDTPLEDVFNAQDIPDDGDFDYNKPPSTNTLDPEENGRPEDSENEDSP